MTSSHYTRNTTRNISCFHDSIFIPAVFNNASIYSNNSTRRITKDIGIRNT